MNFVLGSDEVRRVGFFCSALSSFPSSSRAELLLSLCAHTALLVSLLSSSHIFSYLLSLKNVKYNLYMAAYAFCSV